MWRVFNDKPTIPLTNWTQLAFLCRLEKDPDYNLLLSWTMTSRISLHDSIIISLSRSFPPRFSPSDFLKIVAPGWGTKPIAEVVITLKEGIESTPLRDPGVEESVGPSWNCAGRTLFREPKARRNFSQPARRYLKMILISVISCWRLIISFRNLENW